MWQKPETKLWASKQHHQKVATLIFMMSKELCIKIKENKAYFQLPKEDLGYVFSARRNLNFHEKGVTKIELQNGQLFSNNFELCQFFYIFRKQN